MAHFAEDYYDMPIELLPSSNFAGRPTSDIDVLHGTWTMVASSSLSSEGEADEHIDNGASLEYTSTAKRTQSNSWHAVEGALGTSRWSREGGLRPQRALPAPPVHHDVEALSVCTSSFSDKARVRPRRRRKHLEQLDTALADDASRRGPASPSSMLSTPRELYAIPDLKASCQTSGSSSSPQSCCAQKREVANIMPSPPTRPNVRWHKRLKRKRKHNSGDVDAAKKPSVYMPGPIMLTRHPAKLRRDSVATLDAFIADTELEPSQERYSDVVGLDDMVRFFEDFGLVAEATEATLDKYWLQASPGRRKSDAIIEGEGVSSGMETRRPKGDWTVQSPQGSNLSLSSVSCTPSAPPPAKRKRSRLRGLLSPGLPGSAFLKSPESRGQQAEG